MKTDMGGECMLFPPPKEASEGRMLSQAGQTSTDTVFSCSQRKDCSRKQEEAAFLQPPKEGMLRGNYLF